MLRRSAAPGPAAEAAAGSSEGGCRSAGPPAPSLPPPAALSLSHSRLVLGFHKIVL